MLIVTTTRSAGPVDRWTVGIAEGTFPVLDAAHAAAEAATLREISLTTPGSLRAADGCAALGLHPLTAEQFAAFPTSVQVVGRAAIGLDTIDLDAAAQHGVTVVHQPDYATDEVATHALVLVLVRTAGRRR